MLKKDLLLRIACVCAWIILFDLVTSFPRGRGMSYRVPKCLKRRHKILDSMEKAVTRFMQDNDGQNSSSEEEGVPKKLVCHLWNMIKENPPCEGCCDLSKNQGSQATSSTGKSNNSQNRKTKPPKESKHLGSEEQVPPSGKYCEGRIYQVFNATEVKQFDDNCALKINDLILEHNVLIEQIQDIEKREEEGMKLLQEADEMWERMEEAYRIKIDETWKRQKILAQQLQEIDESTRNWKNAKKDTEFEINVVEKVKRELIENHERKKNKIKLYDTDIANFEKKIKASQREIEATEKSLVSKTKHSDAITEKIANKVKELSARISEESKLKAQKETEGVKYVNEARDDLQRIWKLLLEKKLQTEDLRLEQESIQNDIAILKATFEDCKERCKQKQDDLLKQIQQYDSDIANMTSKCSRCHQIVDTSDVKNVCTDCPRCLKHRECLRQGDTCTVNPDKQCVCVVVKHKFMENVLENMNAVLQKQIQAGSGKAVGEVVLKCLERSINGKVDVATKKILKDFILTTVRKHLDMTIVGGAVKTRCEMDDDTYRRLMLCVNETNVQKVQTEDKTTNKKSPCRYWNDTECNCVNGPKSCMCSKRAPQTSLSEPMKGCYGYSNQIDRGVGVMKICKMHEGFPPGSALLEDFVTGNSGEWRDPCKSGTCPGIVPVQNLPKVGTMTSKRSSCSSRDHSCGPVCSSRDSDKDTTRLSKTREPTDSEYLDSDTSAMKHNQQNKNIHIQDDSAAAHIKGTITSDFTLIGPGKASITRLNKKCISNEGVSKPAVRRVKRRKKGKPSPKQADSDDVIELTRTPSGNPAMAFDENMIEKINRKLNESSDMEVNLRRLSNDRFILEIDNENNADSEVAKIRKTASGNLVLDAPKTILQSTNKTEKPNPSYPSLEKPSGDTVKLCIQTENGESTYVDGTITKSASGNLRVDLQNSLKLKDFLNEKVPNFNFITPKQPSLLSCVSKKMEHELGFIEELLTNSKLSSGRKESILTKISKKIQNELRCPEDLPILLKIIEDSTNQADDISTKPKPQSAILNKMCKQLEHELGLCESQLNNDQNLHKIRIFGLYPNELFEPPAVLRRTKSGHYVFIMDKEYDKEYRKAINNNETNEKVRVSKSESGKFINIDLNCNNKDPNDTECNITKTISGNLKLMITDKEIKGSSKKPVNSYEKVSGEKINEAFENILCKIFPNNIDPNKRIIEVDDSIDYYSMKNECDTTNNNELFLSSHTSDPIKRTESGTYFLILDSKSKQNFIDNIQLLLKKKRNIVPISTTKTGDIKIELIRNDETKEKEYLRITPSGNVYLLVNDQTVEGLNANTTKKTSNQRLTDNTINNYEKSVGTFCNANPTEACCNVDVCTCEELLKELNDNCFVIDYKTSFVKAQRNDDFCNDEVNTESYDPCVDCNYGQHEYEHWFCMTDSSCLSYDNKCVSDSNEIMEISSTCDEELDVIHSEVKLQQERNTKVLNEFFWDHIEDLPHQLPVFLRNC